MNTKLLLSASAAVMGLAGIAGTFAPQELARAAGFGSAAGLPLLIQVAGALFFGFAMINWFARGSLIGGIYNRPVAAGNLAHFVIGGLALAKAVAAGEHRVAFVVAAVVYAVFAVAFSAVFFRSPVSPDARR